MVRNDDRGKLFASSHIHERNVLIFWAGWTMIFLAVAFCIFLSIQDFDFLIMITVLLSMVLAGFWIFKEEQWFYEGGVEVRTRFHEPRFYPWHQFKGYRITYNKFTKREDYRTYYLVLDSRTRLSVNNHFENTDDVWRTIEENVPILMHPP